MTRQQVWFRGGIGCAAVAILGVVLMLLLAAQPGAPAVTRLQATMARALDAHYNPVESTGVFSPEEPFYLSVRIEGAPPDSVVAAKWSYDGAVITRQEQALGREETVYVIGFELRRADALWPVGEYDVELLLNGQHAGELRFSVVQTP